MSSVALSEQSSGNVTAATPSAPFTLPLTVFSAVLLAVLLGVNLPLFVCMPLDCDVHFYDLCARNLLRGGTHYVDLFDTNLPGMPWIHVLVRSLVGWRSEALRLVDFGVVAAIAVLLVGWLPASAGPGARMLVAGLLFAFYFSTTEWCHAQRDTWMLLPCLGALALRRRRVNRLVAGRTAGTVIALSALLEGLLWAAAFWIKPFVGIPALFCWLTSSWQVRREVTGASRWLLLDGLMTLLGGLLAGAAGVFWMWRTGAWSTFLEIMFVWNRDYIRYDPREDMGWLYVAGFGVRFFPWLLVHLVAVPLAVETIFSRTCRGRHGLLAAVYLGWLLQAYVVQHLFDYVHVPEVLLALTLVAWRCRTAPSPVFRRCLILLLVLCPLLRYPGQLAMRLPAWESCLREGSTSEVRDRVTLLRRIRWVQLRDVETYLRNAGVGDGELTCYSMPTASLYLDLGVRPATRHILLQNGFTIFTSQRQRIASELAVTGQRYVVCDLYHRGIPDDEVPGRVGERELPQEAYPLNFRSLYPGGMTLVFRSGRYVVFRLD
jgi:hypothetical protein